MRIKSVAVNLHGGCLLGKEFFSGGDMEPPPRNHAPLFGGDPRIRTKGLSGRPFPLVPKHVVERAALDQAVTVGPPMHQTRNQSSQDGDGYCRLQFP
jgi:hypothetical protein